MTVEGAPQTATHERRIKANPTMISRIPQISRIPDLVRRDIVLATNKDSRVSAGLPDREPLAYIEEELERMFAGKNVTIIDYPGRNTKSDLPHQPGSNIDFKNAWEKTKAALERFNQIHSSS